MRGGRQNKEVEKLSLIEILFKSSDYREKE